ncbi:MAG: hypothetical protein H6737_10735 [Alphaproteobacteria bacterium]|nr:hypothetical protein [Alphaproteobacteria bacterium]
MLVLPLLVLVVDASASGDGAPPAGDTDCRESFDDQEIKGVGARAEDAFANLDEEGFVEARDELLTGIECATEALTSSAVAGYFRVRALDAHLRRAPEDLKLNVAAMAEIDPMPPSSSVTPRGHPVRNAWEAAKAAGPGPTRPLPVPSGGRIRIDGRDTLDFPTERPTIIQLVNAEGALDWTRVIEVGGLPPEYAEASEDYRQKYENAIIVSAPRKPIELPILAGVFGAGAIGTYAATFHTRSKFFSEPDPTELRTLRNNNNALVVTSAGLGAVALGLGTWTVLTW